MTNSALNIKGLEKNPINLERVIYHCVSASSWLSVIYLIININADLTLSLIQCILGIAALQVPVLLTKLTRIKLPDNLCSCYYIFILCATVLGEMFSMYYRIPVWDSLLHFGSGIMIGMAGSIFLVTYLKNKDCKRLITPMVIAVSAVCFSISIGVFWEIYEFAADSILGLNMQKCFLEDGTALIGQAGLIDTMKDLIIDTLGAIVAAISAFLSLKHNKGWLNNYKYKTN